VQQDNRVSAYAFATAFKAQVFGGRSFYANQLSLDTEHFGDIHTHLVSKGRKARLLCNDDAVYVFDAPSVEYQELVDPPEELKGVGAFVGRICGRKVLADVAEVGGTEQGVHDCMNEYVGIRVAGQASRILDVHTAQYEWTILGRGGECMCVYA